MMLHYIFYMLYFICYFIYFTITDIKYMYIYYICKKRLHCLKKIIIEYLYYRKEYVCVCVYVCII